MRDIFNEMFRVLKNNLIEDGEIGTDLQKYFEGVFKITLVVLNDSPEFLSFYYFEFVNNLPMNKADVLRSAILAAYPK